MYQDREPAPVMVTRAPPAGAIYLQGFADGYHGRAATVQRTKKAQAAYAKGYQVGQAARPK